MITDIAGAPPPQPPAAHSYPLSPVLCAVGAITNPAGVLFLLPLPPLLSSLPPLSPSESSSTPDIDGLGHRAPRVVALLRLAAPPLSGGLNETHLLVGRGPVVTAAARGP